MRDIRRQHVDEGVTSIRFQFDYVWQPFTVNNRHITFSVFKNNEIRLVKDSCSHWGAAIYKWEGELFAGDRTGETGYQSRKKGIYIGETNNIRARLNQYKSGTQPGGNLKWRENYLNNGVIFLYMLGIQRCSLGSQFIEFQHHLTKKHFRLILEQLLLLELHELYQDDPSVWIVNHI